MLKEKLMEDLKISMREKNTLRKDVIQMVRASILQIEKDKQIQLTDDQIIEVMAKEAKKRKDSLEDYLKSGREDLIQKIQEEIAIINEYLPQQLTKDEIAQIVKQIIVEVDAKDMKDMGKVMKAAKEKMGATADGKTINEVVKELLQ
jgi:uncharacterized protein